MNDVAKRLKKLRTATGLNQAAFCKEIGIAATTYSQFESGKRKVNSEWLAVIAKYLYVSSDYILGITEYEKSHLAFTDIFIDNGDSTITLGEFYRKLCKLNPENKNHINAIVDAILHQ